MDNTEAINRIKDHIRIHHIGEYPHIKIAEALNMAISALENDNNSCNKLEVIRGRWVPFYESETTKLNPNFFAGCDRIVGYKCSECRKETICDYDDEFILSNFCPNCGAKMDLEE